MTDDKHETTIPFDPSPQDVVSTKLRSWNQTHPGNLAYQELLNHYAHQLSPPSNTEYETNRKSIQEYAVKIANYIEHDLGGIFIKIDAGVVNPKICTRMNERQILEKIRIGLRNKYDSLLKRKSLGIINPTTVRVQIMTPMTTTKRNKQQKMMKRRKTTNVCTTDEKERPIPSFLLTPSPPIMPSAKRAKRRKQPSRPSKKEITEERAGLEQEYSQRCDEHTLAIRYQAKQGQYSNIAPYALELITRICNHKGGISLLQIPGPRYQMKDDEAEPEEDRRIRQNLRHRFCAAQAQHISVVAYAKRLVEDIWGGILEQTMESNNEQMDRSVDSKDQSNIFKCSEKTNEPRHA